MLTYEVARDMAGQQIRYAELTCTPYTSVIRGHRRPRRYCEAIEDARRRRRARLRHRAAAGASTSPASRASRRPTRRSRIATEVAPDGLVVVRARRPGDRRAAARSSSRTSTGPARPGCTRCRTPARRPARRRSGTRSAARRRADRPRHVGDPGPRAARLPRRARHPARGLPDLQHRHPRGRRRSTSTRSARWSRRACRSRSTPTTRRCSAPRSTSEYAVAARLLDLDEAGLADLARDRGRRRASPPSDVKSARPRRDRRLRAELSSRPGRLPVASGGVWAGSAEHRLGSRPDRPFHARLTRCAATTFLAGLRASSHHWPVVPTMPTSIWAYIGAYLASKPRLLELRLEDVLHPRGDVADDRDERAGLRADRGVADEDAEAVGRLLDVVRAAHRGLLEQLARVAAGQRRAHHRRAAGGPRGRRRRRTGPPCRRSARRRSAWRPRRGRRSPRSRCPRSRARRTALRAISMSCSRRSALVIRARWARLALASAHVLMILARCGQPLSRRAGRRLASRRSWTGQRTAETQPSFSKPR